MHERFFTEDGEEIIKHERKHGCVLVLKRQEIVKTNHFLKIYLCLQHNTEVCGAGNGTCGIPFGRHVEYCEVERMKPKTTAFSDFIINATDEEKESVFKEVINRSIEDQYKAIQ